MSGCSNLRGTPRLTLEALKNAQVRYIDGTYVQLTDGVYKKLDEGFSPTTSTLLLLEQPMAFADLNADGFNDAIVILEWNGGGSGSFPFLVVVLNQNGTPFAAADTELGDRTKINDIQINGKIITLEVVMHGPEDGLCCPTLNATWRFRFENDQLIPLQFIPLQLK
jgi:hypothetical protein